MISAVVSWVRLRLREYSVGVVPGRLPGRLRALPRCSPFFEPGMFKPSQIGRMPFQPLLDTQLIAVGLLLLLPLIARSLEPVAPSAGTDSAHHDLAGAAADIMYKTIGERILSGAPGDSLASVDVSTRTTLVAEDELV